MNRLAIALCAAFLAIPQFARAEQAVPPPTPVRETLSNGLRVVLLPNDLAPVATTILTYGVGADDDSQPGIAHAVEHMLFRGTNRVSASAFADITARMGAEYNASTTDETTLYYFKIPSEYLDVALTLEADRMTGASMSDASWKTERGAIEQEVRAIQSQPGYRISEKLRERFFAGTPFASAGPGTVESFQKMKASDIAQFYRHWYHPNNATLVIAGEIDPAKTLATIHRLFDPIPAMDLPKRKAMNLAPLRPSVLHDSFDFPTPVGAFVYRLPGTDASDYAATTLLGDIFNSDRAAFADLTMQGRVLGVFNVESAFPETGAAFFAVAPITGQSVDSALNLVNGTLEAYRKDGLPPELIDAAKRRFLSQRAYDASSIYGLGVEWAQALALHRSSPADEDEAVAKLSADDVNAVFRRYVSPENRITVELQAKPLTPLAKGNTAAIKESVQYEPEHSEPLPSWASRALAVPLVVPKPNATVTAHFSNGLTVSVRRETTSPTIALSGDIITNPALYEPKGKEGVADLTDALLGMATTTFDRKAFATQFDAISASADFGTDFSLSAQSRDFEQAVALLADGMLHPVFPADEFAVAKSQNVQNLAAAEKLPETRAARTIVAAVFRPDDPRRRYATAASVSRITVDDVKRWYRLAYRPDLATIAIVGDVDPQSAIATMRKYFGDWRVHSTLPPRHYPSYVPALRKNVTFKSRTITQSRVALTELLTGRVRDTDYVPLLLANTMLSGEGNSSLLFEDLRTRHGYVYSIGSNISMNPAAVRFTVSFESDPKNVTHAQAQIAALIHSLAHDGPTADQVQRAKALLMAERVLPLDSYSGIADDMLYDAKYGLSKRTADRFWAQLLDATPQQIRDAIRRNLNPETFVKVEIAPAA